MTGRLRPASPLCPPGGDAGGAPTPGSGAARVEANEDASAEATLRQLVPTCAPTVLSRLRRERVSLAVDLACLDKEDLRELGLTMLERSKVLQWARSAFPAVYVDVAHGVSHGLLDAGPQPLEARSAETVSTASTNLGDLSTSSCALRRFGDSSTSFTRNSLRGEDVPDVATFEDKLQRRLDEVEQRSEFWCALLASAQSTSGVNGKYTDELRRQFEHHDLRHGSKADVRETVLEDFFDLTEERVAEIYNKMLAHASQSRSDGCICPAELGVALMHCGLPAFDDAALTKVMEAVCGKHGQRLRFAEFETVLTTLKLAQLLGQHTQAAGQVVVVDYNLHGIVETRPDAAQPLREFFFGHRTQPKLVASLGQASLVRWINVSSMNTTLLLALMVKYGLHPLSVEDVIEQCQTKMDRYGGHYFTAIEQLSLVSKADGSPVQVRGRHVSVFCGGPPSFDTAITVTQLDHSFASSWPRDDESEPSQDPETLEEEPWVARLRRRLSAPRSRLRERRADFLLHQVIDVCTDELVLILRAYVLRLGHIDKFVRSHPDPIAAYLAEPGWFRALSVMALQMSVVARRVRGLQRVLRHVMEDQDLITGLSSYLKDVRDHLDEAQEDTVQVTEKCEAMVEAYERAMDQAHIRSREKADKRMQMSLFVLTVFTTLFAPVQIVTSIYGMNLVDPDGKPTIPELRHPHGYFWFWVGTVIYFFLALFFSAWYFRRMKRKREEDKGRYNMAKGQQEALLGSTVSQIIRRHDGSSPPISEGSPSRPSSLVVSSGALVVGKWR